ENAILGPYPGSVKTLDETLGWLVREGATRAAKEADSPPMVLTCFLLTMLRYRVRRQAVLKDLAGESERVLRMTFPASFVHRLLGLLAEVPGLDSTASTANLAERIVALVQKEAQEPPPAPPKADDENAGEQEPDDEDADGDQESADDDATEDEAPAAGDDAAGDQESGDDEAAGDQEPGEDDAAGDQEPDDDDADGDQESDQDEAAGDQEPGDDDPVGRDALRAILSAGDDDLPEDLFEAVAEALNAQTAGTNTPLLPSLEDYQGDAALGNARLGGVKGESAKLAARLQGLVQAHDMAKTRTARRGRALSTRHLHRAAVGDDRIFQRTDQRTTPNTAVHVLIDLSGSMEHGKDRIALEAAMALALALEPIRGVSCAVTAFPSLDGEAEMVTRITSHGDRVAARAGAFVQLARGGTPMTGALWYAAADLLARQEERKVILTLTDGDPNDWDSAYAMVMRAGIAGIEMIGVGIATSVDRLFPVAVQIASVADLKGELFRIAERLLLK
ncbi:VWA domain-containing protein, partial [uncultured Thiodictyon sp.]|uniref:cobaltochelatase CobT-related protein n=1 Tax=uncultured Thiodictyon sp. TaxID=1846217 RepID=UPI0025F6A34C